MKYRFVQNQEDYSDYASGAVFHGAPGQPSFPVRLANEIFQRCLALRQAALGPGPCRLYDPCCGGAYHLSTLAYFNWENIRQIIGSDIDAEALSFARRNLALLTLDGLDARLAEIAGLAAQYHKPSHLAALRSGQALRARLLARLALHPIHTRLFQADATDGAALRQNLGDQKADIVITDIPYGRRSEWSFEHAAPGATDNPLQVMLEALLPVLATGAVVAVASSKQGPVSHPAYQQAGKLKLGKRQVVFLRPA